MEAATPTIPTEKITGEATVLEVGEERRPWESGKGGKFIGYRVKLKLHAAGDVEVGNVEVNTKADNPRFMEPGEKTFGVFDPRTGNQYGPRFQKKNPDGGGGGGGRGKSPMEQARIQRQHSQEMAIRIGVSAGWFAGIDPGVGENGADDDSEPDPNVRQARATMKALLNGPVKRLTDYLDQDIERGAKAALERRQQSGSNTNEQRQASGY